MDRATASLNEVLHSGNYVRQEGIPIFDAHEEHDKDGNLVRRFDRARLEEICRVCNRRAESTGDLSPFGPGHTIPGAPETVQPRIWGFYHAFRVAEYGPESIPCILADRYVKRLVEVELPDGTLVQRDGPSEVASYPRRSVELYARGNLIDWVAQIRRTPQRDLGLDLLAYSSATHTVTAVKTQPAYFGARNARGHARTLAAVDLGGKLFYSMEHSMALNDPTTAPDAKDPDNDFQSQFERCMKGSYPYLGRMHADSATRYEAEDAAAKEAELAAGDPGAPSPVGDPGATPPDVTPGAPGAAAPEPERHEAAAPGAASGPAAASGTNTVVPALGGEKDKDKKKDEEPSRMARDAEAIRYSRLEGDRARLEKENADLREREAKAVAEKNVTQLVAEGIKLDPDKEVLRFMKLDEPARYERMAEIRGNWKRDAYGAAPPPPLDFNHYGAPAKPGSGAGREGELKRYSREQVDKAVALAQEKAIPYERALEEVAAA